MQEVIVLLLLSLNVISKNMAANITHHHGSTVLACEFGGPTYFTLVNVFVLSLALVLIGQGKEFLKVSKAAKIKTNSKVLIVKLDVFIFH